MNRVKEKVTLASGKVAWCESLTALEAARAKSTQDPPAPEELQQLIDASAIDIQEEAAIRMQLRLASKVAPRCWSDEGCTVPLFASLWQAIEEYTVGDLRALSEGIARASLRGSEDTFRGKEGAAAGAAPAPAR